MQRNRIGCFVRQGAWSCSCESGDLETGCPRRPKKFKDSELEAIFNEDEDRFKVNGGKWAPYQLTKRQIKNRKNTSEILLHLCNKKVFAITKKNG